MAGNTSRINGRLGGRPKGAESDETKLRRIMREIWVDQVAIRSNEIIQAHFDLALGIYTEETTTEGVKRVYKRLPDRRSLEWIMEQTWGKAKEPEPSEEEKGGFNFAEMSPEERQRLDEEMERALPLQEEPEKVEAESEQSCP